MDEPISLFEDLKGSNEVKPKNEADLACPTDEKSEFMKNLRKLVPQENGGNDISAVEFSEKFQKKILSLLETANHNKDFDVVHFEEVYKNCALTP